MANTFTFFDRTDRYEAIHFDVAGVHGMNNVRCESFHGNTRVRNLFYAADSGVYTFKD